MVRLKADPNVGGVSYGGQEYPLVKGCVKCRRRPPRSFWASAGDLPCASVQPDMQPDGAAQRSGGGCAGRQK